MSERGGSRDRPRRRTPPPQNLPSSRSRPTNPPSRHLWVGNLSSYVTEPLLVEHFRRFGDLANVAFPPGRSYAFVNYRRDEDAIQAMGSLQGSSFAGASLKIEFAKADKMPAATRDDNYINRRDEQRSTSRSSPVSQRESRTNHEENDAFLPEGSRVGDDSTESPSNVLWIGYPTFLKVDDVIFSKAFSPFGEIEKISIPQGRNYAFVRFRSLMSACRAKETLQGKLFGTPRVHICFARSEGYQPGKERQNSRINSSPSFRSTSRAEYSDDFQLDRKFRNSAEVGPNYFPPERDYGDPDATSFRNNETLRTGNNLNYDQRRIHDSGPEMGQSGDLRGYHNGPEFHEFSPPKFPKRTPYHEEPWDLPEDPHLYREAKKMRTSIPGEKNELPEYRFSDSDRNKHSLRPARDAPLPEEMDHLGFRRRPDLSGHLNRPFVERNDQLMPPRDSFQSASNMYPTNRPDQRRNSPDPPHPTKTQEWKWEGTLAKGGNAICRARCLPVGKVLDIKLPELLDCTARTGLDMLSKHYYQASETWVVFFVPQSDADMSYYNEFMHYLGEKRRAAVAKLDDKNTLFLVPPSDFSEEVLKVPGKLSISGVILRLEPPPAPTIHSLPPIQERNDTNPMPFHNDMLYQRPDASSGAAFPPGFGSTAAQPARFSNYDHQRMPDSADGGRDYMPNHHAAVPQPNPSPHLQNYAPINQDYTSGYQRSSQDAYNGSSYNSSRAAVMQSSGMNRPTADETKPSPSLPNTTFSGLQQDQLAQLASTLLGQQQQRQPGSSSGFTGQSELTQSQRYNPAQASQGPPGFSGPQYQQQQAQMQQQQQPQMQQQQQPLMQQQQQPLMQQQQHPQQAGSNETTAQGAQEAEADPQKRLQATLQLAAALLHQIRQGNGS